MEYFDFKTRGHPGDGFWMVVWKAELENEEEILEMVDDLIGYGSYDKMRTLGEERKRWNAATITAVTTEYTNTLKEVQIYNKCLSD